MPTHSSRSKVVKVAPTATVPVPPQAHADFQTWKSPILIGAHAMMLQETSHPPVEPQSSRSSSNPLRLPPDRLSARSQTLPQSPTVTPSAAHVPPRTKSLHHRPRN